MEEKMKALWNYIFEVLYSDKTHLVYEHRTTLEKDGAFVDLPSPEIIQLQIPNPCGWGTGMEDSATSAGILLDATLNRYAVTGEPEMKEYARNLALGIKLCAEVAGKRGFLARSVSPADGKSFYINTSRDQYTHVIFSLVKYLKSPLCDEADKGWIIDLLVGFAQLAEKEVTPENNYELLRADNKPGIVCKMWDVLPHEAMRLHLFYLAAWVASGDEHWLELYRQWRDAGIAKTSEALSAYRIVILVQTQVSLRFFYDYDPDPGYKEKYLELLNFCVGPAKEYTVENPETLEINFLATPWYECSQRFEKSIIAVGGYSHVMPQDPLLEASWAFMDMGDALVTQTLCPGCVVSQAQEKLFETMVNRIDLSRHASRSPIRLSAGYWALRRQKMENA